MFFQQSSVSGCFLKCILEVVVDFFLSVFMSTRFSYLYIVELELLLKNLVSVSVPSAARQAETPFIPAVMYVTITFTSLSHTLLSHCLFSCLNCIGLNITVFFWKLCLRKWEFIFQDFRFTCKWCSVQFSVVCRQSLL